MKHKLIYILPFLVLLLLTQCANMVTPTGGPKDITPPKVVEASPANHSTNYTGRMIELTFDEYISLENANQNLLFSPPLTKKPDVKLKNKTVVIRFKEDLKPNTTYTISFGNAIKDHHEGNIFKDYQYSFSTGEVLDSLSLTGTVLDAVTKKPVEDIYVSLYQESDSLFQQPTLRMPDYIAKADKEGKFCFNGLPEGCYLAFALQDVNANLFYDMPNETVGFLDTLVSLPEATAPLTLYAFTEVDTTQMVLEKKLIAEGVLRFVFRHPAHQVVITADTVPDDGFRILEQWSPDHDTLCWYFTPGLRDSLRVNLHFPDDTLINTESRFFLRFRETNRRASKTLKVTSNLRNGLLMPGEDLLLHFSEPITRICWHDSSALVCDTTVVAYAIDDTTSHWLSFEDGVLRLLTAVNDSASYSLQITDSVFFSVTGRTNDSIGLRFRRATDRDLGAIMITVQAPEHRQAVVQLLNSHNHVVATKIVTEEQRLEFKNLLPEKYSLRAIIDIDRNGRWSTGNFHRGFLPEMMIDYPNPLDVKGGWDIDLDDPWDLH